MSQKSIKRSDSAERDIELSQTSRESEGPQDSTVPEAESAPETGATPVPITATYNRNTGNLAGNGMSPKEKADHARKVVSAQMSQWAYSNARTQLTSGIRSVNRMLEQLQSENDARPVDVQPETNESLEVLRVSLRLDRTNVSGANSQDNLGLDRPAMAALLGSQIQTACTHLGSLQRRVDDQSSKVFVTGDINTGKTAFCNALLHRHLLPEDQLPCTTVFCEVREARENDNIEEVHAIPLSLAPGSVNECISNYDPHDTSTYEIFPLTELDELVPQSDKYAMLKVYIRDDARAADSSLLRNGTVDIALIDSPGLNRDSVQTSEVISRQDEIDLVVFVVNAENQLTLSAQEFIALASREKKLMFFAVNKFDRIRDKERCKRLILDQIKELSPESYKRAPEFVHFLTGPRHDDGPGGDGDDSDDDNDDNDPDFQNMENNLRNFVLKRRAQSKLLPAKTYLTKVLHDITSISQSNLSTFKEEESNIKEELKSLDEEVATSKKHYSTFTKAIDALADQTVTETYDYTKQSIMNCLNISISDMPQYQGISQLYDFVFYTEHYIRDQIRDSIVRSELHARAETKRAVEQICQDGQNELGDEFMSNRVFDSSLMFSQSVHSLSKKFSMPLTVSDLYAPSWEGLMNYLSWALFSPAKLLEGNKPAAIPSTEKDDSKSGSLALVGSVLGLGNYPISQYWKRPSLLFTSKLPALAIYSLGGSKIVTTVIFNGLSTFTWRSLGQISGSVLVVATLLGASYFVYDLPRALPQNLLAKYTERLQSLDYTHTNSKRISGEVAGVLRTPTREIVRTCELLVDRKQENKRELERRRESNTLALHFFEQLLATATTQTAATAAINLEIE